MIPFSDPHSHGDYRLVDTTGGPTPRRRRSPQNELRLGCSPRPVFSPTPKQPQVRRTRKDPDPSIHQTCPSHTSRNTRLPARLSVLRDSRRRRQFCYGRERLVSFSTYSVSFTLQGRDGSLEPSTHAVHSFSSLRQHVSPLRRGLRWWSHQQQHNRPPAGNG